jgi:hypothetical protein
VNIGISDDRDGLPAQAPPALFAQFGEQAGADAHLIRAPGQFHGNYSH